MAAICVAKENELVIERLRLGPVVLDPEEPPDLSTQMWKLALSYISQSLRQACSDVALLVQKVALLGITKEAHTMVQSLEKGLTEQGDPVLCLGCFDRETGWICRSCR